MRRFYVEKIEEFDGLCPIRGQEARHMAKVLRMAQGDPLILMDQNGSRFHAVIEVITAKEVRVRLKEALPRAEPPPVEIVLCQALLKAQSMDYLVQKGTELGLARLMPYVSDRTIPALAPAKASNRLRRWQEITRSAAKQCDRAMAVQISPPCSFNDLMTHWKDKEVTKILLWEGEEIQDLKGLLRGIPTERTVVGLVGPEGGLDRKEVEMAEGAGFRPVSLGKRILRSETAGAILVALIQYDWGDLSLQRSF